MDFEFDENQLDLQTAAAEILAKECSSTYLRTVWDGTNDPSKLQATLASLDWPGLAIAAEDGGVGASAIELAIVVEQLGYVADPTPFLATTTQFAPVISACGNAEQRQRFLPAVSDGSISGTLALASSNGRWDIEAPPLSATRNGDSWDISGTCGFVVDGDRVNEVAAVATTVTTDSASQQIFVVPASSITTNRCHSLDNGMHVAELSFDGVSVGEERRLTGGNIASGLRRGLDESLTGLAMTTVGACQRALDMTLEYVTEREQFGVPIGSFQAVKHKAVDMYVAIERARALGYFAALTISDNDPRRSLAAAMAKAAAGDAQFLVMKTAIQLFGGIGFTWENDVHLYLRRAKACELLFGGAAQHRSQVGITVLAQFRKSGQP